ncbi:MAG: carbonic anhydrase [Chlamydiales bacterium]
MSPEQALQRLREGNGRYVRDELEHPDRDSERRMAIVANQSPFAIIVGCSDSRVSPEILFDQGIGDLFVVRVAGNVIGPLEIDSVDYAALYLGAACVVVMGHERCGAVQAVVTGQTKDIESIAKLIEPAVGEARQSGPDDLLARAVKNNAVRMREYLLESRVIKKLVQEKKIIVRAAYYNLATGAVEWL